MGIQDNLWTAYLSVAVFFALCLLAVFLAIRFMVKIFKSFSRNLNDEYERESRRNS